MRKHFLNRRGVRHVANQKPGRIRTSYGSPGRGAFDLYEFARGFSAPVLRTALIPELWYSCHWQLF